MPIPTIGQRQGPDQDSIADGEITSPTPGSPVAVPIEDGAAARLADRQQRLSRRAAVADILTERRRSR